MSWRRGLAVLVCVALSACGSQDPPQSPTTDPPVGGIVTISGTERIGWTQLADSQAELAAFGYVIYVDGTPSDLTGVRCERLPSRSGFDCTANLPPLTPGAHSLEITSFALNFGDRLESGRSSPLQVIVAGAAGVRGLAAVPVVTAERIRLILSPLAEGLIHPTDLAFLPGGEIFIAERGGTVKVLRDGKLLTEPALDLSEEISTPSGGLLAIAADPDYAENGFVYALSASRSIRGAQNFTLSRFRSVRDVLGERAVLLDQVPAAQTGAAGALRIGRDGKLFVALDQGASSRNSASYGSYNGKVLRLNSDATTPQDQANSTPIYSLNHPYPKALTWQPASGELWVLDDPVNGAGRLSVLSDLTPKQRRGTVRASYSLPEGLGATSTAFYQGILIPIFKNDLFIAADAGQQLVRVQFDAREPQKMVSFEPMLKGQIGPIEVVAEGPDGGLYVATETALYRLAP